MPPEFPGICGPANRPCKISHSSTYPNQVGVYPSDFLPSTFTIWHAVFASQFPLAITGDTSFVDILGPGLGGITTITPPEDHIFQSHHYVIFARTDNKINFEYTITESDIENMDTLGVAEIELNDFVFEVVAVTSEPMDPNTDLTAQEKEDLQNNPECTEGCSSETQSDREFRKLFEIPLRNTDGQLLVNLFLGIVPNILGVEYRLDNGTAKSKLALDQAGLGNLDDASYRDGSSKKIRVQLSGSGNEEDLVAGDTIFLTYVAIKEHYLRQRVSTSWKISDANFQCVATDFGFSIAHFRFYEWEMEAEDGSAPTKLSGWRVVETFSSDVNFVAPIGTISLQDIGDFVIGGERGVSTVVPGKVSPSRLQEIIDDRSLETSIGIDLQSVTPQNEFFHINSGKAAFQEDAWFLRNEFSKYRGSRGDAGAYNHVFFNVHPKALRKRDVDKFGIERFLAEELKRDFSTGTPTHFPFMDDPDIDNPILATKGLDSSNALFQPILPATAYGGNFTVTCGSLGSFPTAAQVSDGLNSYHSFESNRIDEKFEIDTRVLVERNFVVNGDILGPTLITIEGVGAGDRGSVSCVSDPSKEFQFASHINDDGFLIFNTFNSGYTAKAIRELSFRPDHPSPPFKDNANPTVDQFEDLIGFGSMIGDIPGIQPGRTISLASFAESTSFTFKTTATNELSSFIEEEQIEEIELPALGISPLVIPVINGYYGSIKIKYRINSSADDKDKQAMLLIKTDGVITGSVDSLAIQTSSGVAALGVDFRWLRASSFELVGDRVEDMEIVSVVLRALDDSKLNDFLNEETSHTSQFAEQTTDERLTDRSLFFSTNVVSVSEDEHSNLFIFFNDTDGGISVVSSNDYGSNWIYYYGIVEKINTIEALDPFVVNHAVSNGVFLFYRFKGKVLCKKINYSMFAFRDANLIERFNADIIEAGDTEADAPKEGESIYTTLGKLLRRSVISNVAAGDLTDESFLEIVGKVPGKFEYVPTEEREVDGNLINVRKNTIAISSGTAFVNIDINNSFFSAYRKDNGEMKLWHLAPTEASSSGELQCNVSTDDGQSWFDLWEYIANSRRRFRIDVEKNTQFIDRGASGTETPTSLEGTDPQEGNQFAQFGINIHWSRLSRHKISSEEGESTVDSESQVLRVSSPYVFYQPTTDRVFLFYIYEECLLCKVFNDSTFSFAARIRESDSPEQSGMGRVKDVIERQTRAHFIDGSLSSSSLQEEIHGFTNDDTQEVMANGNIIFKYPFAVDNFTDDRAISRQRVCAVDLPTGLIRVFYKHKDSINLKSALWTGSEWWAEDFLRTSSNLTEFIFPDNSEFTEVTGGFGETA